MRKSKKTLKPIRQQRRNKNAAFPVVRKAWLLIYDPKAHSENPKDIEDAYWEGTSWDIYNIRATLEVGNFHEGIKFFNESSKHVRVVMKVKKPHNRFKYELVSEERWLQNLQSEETRTIENLPQRLTKQTGDVVSSNLESLTVLVSPECSTEFCSSDACQSL